MTARGKTEEEINNLRQENNRDQENAEAKKLNLIQENLSGLNRQLEDLNRELRKAGKNEGQNEAISKLIDEFLGQLEVVEKETDLIQDLDDDDYSDDDDITGEREFDLNKKTRKERGDFRSGMRHDVEKSKAEDFLRQMGVDWQDRGSLEDDY